MVGEYLEARKKDVENGELRPHSYYGLRWQLNGLWKPWHNEPFATFDDVDAHLETIKEAHGKTSAGHARGGLRALCVWGIRKKYCKVSPVVGTLDPMKGKKPRKRVLTVAEFVMILQYLPNNAFGRIMWLLLLLGAGAPKLAVCDGRKLMTVAS